MSRYSFKIDSLSPVGLLMQSVDTKGRREVVRIDMIKGLLSAGDQLFKNHPLILLIWDTKPAHLPG